MQRFAVACAAVVSMIAVGAAAEEYKSPRDECFRTLKDLEDAYADKDVGEKAAAEVVKLIEISDHLCNQGNFAYAHDIMRLARSMLVSE